MTRTELEALLGLPLDTALAILAEAGITPKVTVSGSRREPDSETTLRVVRAEEDGLTVCRFRDGTPQP